MALSKDLKEFVELLNAHGVDFLVVGGHAVGFHGWPRFTEDLDLFVRPSFENGQRLLAALQAFGFGDVGLEASSFSERGQVIQLGRAPNRVDLMTGIDGVDFEDAWKHRLAGNIEEIPVAVLGLQELVANKRATGRPQDLADIDRLEKLSG